MEKLTPKHNHTLTDILKVGIFGIILLLPFLLFIPSIAYFGFNKEANVPTKTVNVQEEIIVDFNQYFKANENAVEVIHNGLTLTPITNGVHIEGTSINALNLYSLTSFFDSSMPSGYLKINHKILFNFATLPSGYQFGVYNTLPDNQEHISQVYNNGNYYNCYINVPANTYINVDLLPNAYDLTQMYGVGNEPTIQEFNATFPNVYYPFTTSEKKQITIDVGTETLADITTQVELNWEQIWNRPLFSWTKYTILIQGLDKFTYIFGIVDTCYITNLLTYELVMIAIYIVFDIILKMFTWLTHMIGNK